MVKGIEYCGTGEVIGAGGLFAVSAQQPARTEVREDCAHCPWRKWQAR
jgi:hypothetical protein